MMKSIASTITALALVLAFAVIAIPQAIALECTEVQDNSASCLINAPATIVFEKLGNVDLAITENQSQVTIGVETNETATTQPEQPTEPAIDPCAPENIIVDNSTLQCGAGNGTGSVVTPPIVVTPNPPVQEPPMVVPEPPMIVQ